MVITDGPVARGAMDVLSVRVDHVEEIAKVVAALRERPELKAVHLFGEDVDALWKAFKGHFVLVEAAGGAVTDEHGRLLVIRRLGKWDLPKGKVEEGEDLPAAAVREVQEECGISTVALVAPLMETWHTYERKGRQHLKRTSWYLMNGTASEELTAQQEEGIEEVRWMDAAGVRTMEADTYSSLLPVLAAWRASFA